MVSKDHIDKIKIIEDIIEQTFIRLELACKNHLEEKQHLPLFLSAFEHL